MSYYDRYMQGEEVWPELIAFGGRVRDGELRGDVDRVTGEIVDRMRWNVEQVVLRLHELGYQFGAYDGSEEIPYYEGPFRLAAAKDLRVLSKVEKTYGPLPLLLHAWYSKIGLVDLMGFHPDWTVEYPDPLVVSRLDQDGIADEYDGWQMEDDGTKFRLSVAPDFFHKANVSGGPPYGFELPNECVDGRFVEEPDYSYFYNYLKRCIKWGGFPGVAKQPSGIPTAHLEFLTQGLRSI